MSPPVRPEQTLPPQELARIQANVAKMRSMGAPESDVLAYLQHEDSLATALPHDTMNAVDPNVTADNMARSLAQGVSMGFGDELAGALHGSAARDEYRRNANAFKSAHPIVDAALKTLGAAGASAPLLVFGPEVLGTAKGMALLSGAQGALQGAGESDSPTLGGRLLGAGEGAATGVAGGLLGYGGAKVLGSAGTSIMDRINPERAVAKAAAPLLNAGKLAEVDAVAPGGASLATTAVPTAGMKLSRLNYFLRGIGASPAAGARAENNFLAQGAALEQARLALGDRMNALNGEVPVDDALREVMKKARGVLGSKAPMPPAAEPDVVGANPLGIEKSVPFAFDPEQKTVDIQSLRDALSRLRYAERQAVKRGTEANGADLADIKEARQGLQNYLYDKRGDFAELDRNYATVMRTQAQNDKALETVQRSRSAYGANNAYKQSAGSLGGSLPKGHGGLATAILDKIFLNKAGAADATARLLTTPGGPELIPSLLSAVPTTTGKRIPALVGGSTAASANALRGLLFSPDSTQ